MTTFSPFSCLKHGRWWCCRSLAKCSGCPNWDRASKLHYKSWKTASISKSTRRHFRHQPRPLHPIMETTVTRERSRRDRGESGKFSPERIASTAMDGSLWLDRMGSCPSLWALFSSQVDYSLYLSESMFHIRSTILSYHLRVQSLFLVTKVWYLKDEISIHLSYGNVKQTSYINWNFIELTPVWGIRSRPNRRAGPNHLIQFHYLCFTSALSCLIRKSTKKIRFHNAIRQALQNCTSKSSICPIILGLQCVNICFGCTLNLDF